MVVPDIPFGTCLFCGTQNDPTDERCKNCGKPIPPAPGTTR